MLFYFQLTLKLLIAHRAFCYEIMRTFLIVFLLISYQDNLIAIITVLELIFFSTFGQIMFRKFRHFNYAVAMFTAGQHFALFVAMQIINVLIPKVLID